MIPPKLKRGDHVRCIAPAHSFSDKFTPEKEQQAIDRLAQLGLEVSFGKYVHESDEFNTCAIEKRLKDLHEAFADPQVHAIISANGGSCGNQLLKYIDYELLRNNPKIFCGLSDNTEFHNAFYEKSGLVSYNGPNFTTIGASSCHEYLLHYFEKAFFQEAPFFIEPSKYYSDSKWSQEKIVNQGYWAINEGEAEAICIGGNMLTFNFMLGNGFMPKMEDCILFLEENHIIDYKGVQKEIQEILNHPDSGNIRGLLIGRFQRASGMTRELLTKIIKTKTELERIPVIANVDLGHTVPIASFPFGGTLRIKAGAKDVTKIEVLKF